MDPEIDVRHPVSILLMGKTGKSFLLSCFSLIIRAIPYRDRESTLGNYTSIKKGNDKNN
uniref:Uncharacterized protein n=1 Tax=Rhizophagus irregularis (strain DAOM 181602 / DAOM 197198 / MUCL 43194) TaxID=747089 RepID=U9TH35_RHIID